MIEQSHDSLATGDNTMSPDANKPKAAVFWDAENVTSVRDERIAEGFKNWLDAVYDAEVKYAFADWNGPYQDVGKRLYRIDFDLIHVPDDLKDSADCQMATYVVNWLVRSPDTESFILVSSDAVFEPLMIALQKQGKDVVVVSSPMITRPETVIRSDEYLDIDSFRPVAYDLEVIGEEHTKQRSPEELRAIGFRRLQETIVRIKKLGKATYPRYVEAVVKHLNPEIDITRLGFEDWGQLISQALIEELVVKEGEKPYTELKLRRSVAKLTQDQTDTLDATFEKFRELVESMASQSDYMGMERVVQKVRSAGIDFTKHGYDKFGDFVRAAESRNLVRIEPQEGKPPAVKPVYTVEQMKNWYENNVKDYFGSGAKVPRDRYIQRTIQMLYKYDVSIPGMEKYLKDRNIQRKYQRILKASGLSFIPPYEQIIVSILFAAGWECEDVIDVVNSELEPLGYAVECP